MPNDGIVSTFSEGDLARLTRRKYCGKEHVTPVLRPGENDETRRLKSTLHRLQPEGGTECLGSDGNGDKSIPFFFLSGGAIAGLEARLRAQEETLRLPHAVQLPPVIGLPPVDEDINRRSGELWSTPQQLAMRARQNRYAMAPAPVDEDIHHRSGEAFLNTGLSRSSEPNWPTRLMQNFPT
jgi:hypothetical protein